MIDKLLGVHRILVPAYGRDYKTPEEVFNDFWHKELDFKLAGTSTYCSVRDFRDDYVTIRYDGLTKLACIHAGRLHKLASFNDEEIK